MVSVRSAILHLRKLQLIATKSYFRRSNAPQGENNSFSNTSSILSGSIAKYYWDFNDGQFSVARTPQHTFENYGTYRVKLEATSDNGCLDSAFQNIEIYNVPRWILLFRHLSQRSGIIPEYHGFYRNQSLLFWISAMVHPSRQIKDPVHHYSSPGQNSFSSL
jgi:hypothetical protein